MNRVIAFGMIMLLIPIWLLCAVLILIFDGSPILFKQKRIGLNTQSFILYKFRTMRKDTPDIPTHLFTDAHQFIIRQVKWVRTFSLDELPNLINIMRGDMNFIGPRPALYNQLDLIELRKSMNIDSIKPGITGWAQVNGRDDISIQQKVELDQYYLKHQSFKLDVKILLMTFKNVLHKKGIKH